MSPPHEPVPLTQRVGVTLALLFLSLSLLVLRSIVAYFKKIRKGNVKRRRLLIERLGLPAEASSREKDSKASYQIIGFFHPYCNAGGGGERVLFEAIRYHINTGTSIDNNGKEVICVIYTGDIAHVESLTGQGRTQRRTSSPAGAVLPASSSSIADGGGVASKEEILRKANDRFGIPLHEAQYASRIAFLPLQSRGLVADGYWKRLTMLGQSLGGAILAKEACEELIPDIFIDTMGYAFSFPVVRLFTQRQRNGRTSRRTRIGAYIHYPTISTDMLRRVANREAGHTNEAKVSSSWWRSRVKLVYYRLFARIYTWALRKADVLVVNGTWTCNHINSLLSRQAAQIVYPPCDVSTLAALPLDGPRSRTLISLAQFRPEKEHATQIKILAKLFEKKPSLKMSGVKLIMMGSCRNAGDEERIVGLRKLAAEVGVESHVQFIINAPYSTILENLSKASIGLSTMVDEHFGINVVEFMAAGLITLSHASAGPLLDIAVPDANGRSTGFHAESVDDFAERALEILEFGGDEQMAIRRRARLRATEVFSREAFCEMWQERLWDRLVRDV